MREGEREREGRERARRGERKEGKPHCEFTSSDLIPDPEAYSGVHAAAY